MSTKGTRKVSTPKLQAPIQVEKLSKATSDRALCLKCALSNGCRTSFLQPMVPEGYTGKLLLIGEASYEFERTGDIFSSLAGQELKSILQEQGLERAEVAFMPVLRCKPTKTPSMAQIRACSPFVLRAVTLLQPDHILAMGPNAVKSLSNSGKSQPIARLRGRVQTAKYIENDIKSDHADMINSIKEFTYEVTSSLAQLGTSPNEIARCREDIARLSQPILRYPKIGVPRTSKLLGFDTEYTTDKVLCGAVSDGTAAISVEAPQLGKLSPLLSKATLVGHNLPVDLDALLKAKVPGLTVAMEQWLQGRKQRDTLLLAKLRDENRGVGGYTLESLLLADYNVADYKAPTDVLGPDPTLWPVPLRDERCRLDAWATLKVYEATKDWTRGPEEITHAISMTLYRMRHAGIYVSMSRYRTMKTEVYAEEAAARKTLTTFAQKHGMKDFTAKDAEIRELVYNKLGLDVETYTKGGLASASVKVLKEYKEAYPEIQAILALSKADKLKTTYCDGLEAKFQRQPDGRYWIPVYVNALAAKTGRRNSAGPNFQNQPKRVRGIFVSRFKGGSISDNDYSKLEPIAGGWVTGEHRLTEYFTKYPNGYIKIGQDFFKKTVEKDTKEYTMMKSLVLAILYNKKKWSLAEDIWAQGVKLDSNYEKHIDKAGDLLDRFLSELFPGVKRYHRQQEQFVLQHGYIDNAVGQRRRLPLPPEPERSDKFAYRVFMRFKAHVINQSINYPIQSLASYVTGSALIDLERALLSQYKYSYVDYHTALMQKKWPQMPLLCIEVHDDLVLDIPKGMEQKTKEVTHDIMQSVPTLRKLLPAFDTPLSVETKIGPYWGAT